MLRAYELLTSVRFHSLPNSKRYLDNKTAERIVFSRAYGLADTVLGVDADCWQIEYAREPNRPMAATFIDHD
ncbi:DUF3885 domain-containing protein [Rhizobium sp. A22-96]